MKEEVKTLEDMQDFLINSCNFMPFSWDEIEEYNDWIREEIGIKWIKDSRKYKEELTGQEMMCEDAIEKWIMKHLNITEKDLK